MDEQTVRKTDEEWLAELGPERFKILRRAGTEPPFSGELLEVKDDGTFTCGACGAALFASDAKYESHSGWPSFVEPADEAAVTLRRDSSHGMERVEALCSRCGSHLGHVFDDGPADRGGQRFCINSLSLGFSADK
jgi:peptide-methionine (R)-S-oxide reductase